MKKIYLALVMLMVGASSYAQRMVKFEVTLASPASGATLTVGTPFDQQIIIKNLGPDAITPADSVAWIDPTTPSGSFYFAAGYSKAVNDTIQLNASYNLTGGSGAATYCVVTALINRDPADPAIFDTTGSSVCNTVTLDAGTGGTAISEFTVEKNVQAAKLTISPNPAYNTVGFDFVAKNNTAVSARVFDLSGRVIMTNSYGKAYPGQKGYSLDVSSLTPGMYFVELRQDGYKATGKVTKQ